MDEDAPPAQPRPSQATPDNDGATTVVPPTRSAVGRSGRRTATSRLALAVAVVLGGGALFLSGFALGALRSSTPGTAADEQAVFQPFWDTYRAVTEDYAGEPVDRKKLVDGAIKGLISALDDPFSTYLTPDEYRQSLQGLSGRFEGIGARVEMRRVDDQGDCARLGDGCALVVVEPIAGAPAEKAGVRAGDVISAIDGTTVDGLTTDEALKRIRGPKGTTVRLGIDRAGTPLEIAIVRDVVVEPEVEAKTLADGSVGYIRLAGFSDRAAADFGAAVGADIAAGRKRIVVDLRGNPGGYVTDAQKVISQFVPAGTTLFFQQTADGRRTATTALDGGAATADEVRVVVLIDGGSASASEIVAGSLQDLGRATLVGSTSYGKGTIQVWQQLADDNGGFRLTVARWLTPKGRWIHKVGLSPDVPIASSAISGAGTDPVLERALEILAAGAGSAGAGPDALALVGTFQ